MAYTQDELVREIIADLGRLDSGQEPSAEDVSRVAFNIPGILAELSGLNIIYIPDGGSVPDAAFRATVSYAAEAMARDFLKTPDEPKKKAAEDKLRALQRIGKGTGALLKVDGALTQGRGRGYRY